MAHHKHFLSGSSHTLAAAVLEGALRRETLFCQRPVSTVVGWRDGQMGGRFSKSPWSDQLQRSRHKIKLGRTSSAILKTQRRATVIKKGVTL